jgi:hypothetical protein
MLNLSKPKFKQGNIVVVKKGSIVRTTHPKRNQYTLKRNQTIKVKAILPPYFVTKYDYEKYHKDEFPNAEVINRYNTECYLLLNHSVTWAGTGGYWCET